MNLFVVAVGVTAETRRQLPRSLRQVAVDTYPALDITTAWEVDGADFFAGSVSHGSRSAARRYVHTDTEGVLTFYSGLPIAAEAGHLANDAEWLGRHWSSLADALDGQYAVGRVHPAQRQVELLTDPLGLEQVYALDIDGGEVLSNSVAVLQQIFDSASIDVTSAAMMASTGWVHNDRTMLRRVRLLPHGYQLHHHDGTTRRAHRSYARDLLTSSEPLELVEPAVLAAQLTSQVASLQGLAPLHCALTAGRDSRILAALCMRAGVDASYFTLGRETDADVVTGVRLASTFGLPHEILTHEPPDAAMVADAASRLVRQTDGLVSLRQLFTPQPVSHDLGVVLWGVGGEWARARWATPTLVLGPATRAQGARVLKQRVLRANSGLVTEPGQSLVRGELQSVVSDLAAAVSGGLDMVELYLAEIRTRRWAYSTQRVNLATQDTFSPFCTQDFLRATYATSPMLRYAEHLHLRLVQELQPELLRIPYEKGWKSQRPGVAPAVDARKQARKAVRRAVSRAVPAHGRGRRPVTWRHHLRSEWFEVGLEYFRGLCLDQRDSPMWEVVDRSAFEGLMDPSRPAEHRLPHVDRLLNVVTPFAYAATLDDSPVPRLAGPGT